MDNINIITMKKEKIKSYIIFLGLGRLGSLLFE